MSEESNNTPAAEVSISEAVSAEDLDTKADLRAGLIIFCTAVVMAVYFVSGYTF